MGGVGGLYQCKACRLLLFSLEIVTYRRRRHHRLVNWGLLRCTLDSVDRMITELVKSRRMGFFDPDMCSVSGMQRGRLQVG